MAQSIVRARGRQKNRPASFQPASDAQKAIFLKHYAEHRRSSDACHHAGISRAVFKHAMATDEAFMAELERIDDFFLDRLEGIAEQLAEARDVPMLKFLLEKRLPEKYGRNANLTVTHRFASAEDVAKLSDEELEAECVSLGITEP